MRLDIPPLVEPRVLMREPDCTIERIVEFDGVRRTPRSPCACRAADVAEADLPYALCIGIRGEITLGNTTLVGEAACLVPQSATHRTLVNTGDEDAVCLLSGPNL